MSQSTQGFFSYNNSSNSGNNMGSFNNSQNHSSSNRSSGFNQSNGSNNQTSVITVNWEKEVDNVFMDEIGKMSSQFSSGNRF